MKKLILITALAAIIIPMAFAAPGDVVITLTIPAAKVADFRTGFLAAKPVPRILDISDPNNPVMVNSMTDKEWFTKVLRDYAITIYNRGKARLVQEAVTYDPDIME